ncbi:MAG TPA: ABC transporter substrate-binding protein [Acidimicrobiia bacterium]|nr:ABC transporter substrate-binding protein [Acidimicrobiia bacterium]
MRRRETLAAVCGVVMALSAAGCGTRLSHAEIRADAGLSAAATNAAAVSGTAEPGVASGVSNASAPAAAADGAAPAGNTVTGGAAQSASPTAGVAAPARSTGTMAPATRTAAPGTTGGATPAATASQAAAAPTPGAQGAATGAPTAGCTAGSQVPVKIASIGAYSGILGQIIVPGLRGLQAWVTATNARGGLACHPVQLLSADDGSDPARNQALHKQMVEKEGVVAFVYDSSPLGGPASVSYVESKQVPAIGNEGGADFIYDSPMYFPSAASGREIFGMTVGALAKVVPADRKKLAIVTCTEGSPCTIAEQGFVDAAAKVGLQVVYKGKASLTQPDFTAQCLAAKNAGAQLLLGTYTAEGQRRLAKNCQSVGLDAIQAVTGIQASLDFAGDPAMEGVVIAEAASPWFDGRVPAVAEFQDSLKRYAPDVPASAGSMRGWVAAKHFEAAVRTLPPGPITSAGVLTGLYSLRNERLGGLTYPLNSTRGQTAERKACGWPIVIKGGKWTTAGDFFCL